MIYILKILEMTKVTYILDGGSTIWPLFVITGRIIYNHSHLDGVI
jgi:hypothetical protein